MKVTVCFGNVRVVVPCGDGDILVRDLIREAILRYKKAAGKGPDSWLAVHNLQSQGGGILDPDDKLSDVVDDREQILANFEDGDGAHHHGGGDGASGSSVGTGSPDIFHDGEHKYSGYSRTDIEVTGEHLANGIGGVLQVRRGSEPALNQILPVGPPPPTDNTKRWSAAPIIQEPQNGQTTTNTSSNYLNISTDWVDDSREDDEEDNEENSRLGIRRIARDGSNRLSMQFLGDGVGYKWAEAAERAASSKSLPREQKRKEPLGQANNTSSAHDLGELIVIRNEPGPLGIHVVPDYDRQGKDRGLLVQGIEPGGRIDRDGRLSMFDRIIEINGHNLLNLPFQKVQDLFKLSLTSPELRLRVIKLGSGQSVLKPPAPVYPRLIEDKENIEKLVEADQKQSTNPAKVATVSPTKKVPSSASNRKSLLIANTRKIGRKIELELTKGPHGLGFSITTRDNPAGGNCPIYIKNIIPKGAAIEDGRLKIGDRLLEVNGVEMTGKSQQEAVSVLRNAPLGSKVRIVVSRQEEVHQENPLPRVIGVDPIAERSESREEIRESTPPTIPPLPQNHYQRFQHPNQSPAEKSTSNVAKIISQFQEASITNSPADKLDDSFSLPWKHREFLTFNIPVHDSEKAGLGISVKGKTSGSQDLGIFIKSVIHGGAASRDQRLRTNDQLLNVNGISLLNQSNSDAMDTLRKAMCHTEGPIPGNITLTIARRAASPASSRNFSNSRSLDNSFSSNNGGEVHSSQTQKSNNSNESEITDHSGGSVNTVIFNNNHNKSMDSSKGSFNHSGGSGPCSPPIMNTWNPVLDRLTGNKQLRNESYYRATNDTWNQSIYNSPPNGNIMQMQGATLNMIQNNEPVLIEDEYGSRIIHSSSRSKIHQSPSTSSMQNALKVANSNGSNGNLLENRQEHTPDRKQMSASNNGTNNNASCDKTIGSSASSNGPNQSNVDVTYASQLSLENPAGFSRDAFGRQSMSEKRHATLDAKTTDTYQRTKKMREERLAKGKETNLVRVGSVESVISVNRSSEHPEYADKLGQLGPSLGMKKSSSLESLQTMVQEIQMQEEGDPAYSYRGPAGALKVIRGKGREQSLRAAVTDDYAKNLTDPKISAKKHWLLDPPTDYDTDSAEGFSNVRGGPRQSSLNAALDAKNKAAKKKPGIFKGIGSMFRFGKHRKIDFPSEHYIQNNSEFEDHSKSESENADTTKNSIASNESTQKQSSSQLQQQQTHPQNHQEPVYQQRPGFVHHHAEQVQVIPENGPLQAMGQRYRPNHDQQQHRSNLLKAHEHRMAARHSYYPPSDADPHYEQIARQHPNAEYGRPGSRSGLTEAPAFTHYVNYKELQTHLSRKQHQYHSQRQPKQEMQLRPVSNFYEYESVQSLLNTRGRSVGAPGQPQFHQRQYQQHQPQSRYYNRRGPFVTQVTIGEQREPKQNGTKV